MGCINLKKDNEIIQSRIPPKENFDNLINQEQINKKDEKNEVPKVLIINTNNNNNLGLNNENIISNFPKNFSNMPKSHNINNKDIQNINNSSNKNSSSKNIELKKKKQNF
jgi:hypothetical protein